MLRPRSSNVSVQKVVLCPFHCKPRQSGVSLQSPVPENIPHFRGNRDEVGQNNDARKAVPVTLSFLKVKWGYILAQMLESERSKSLALSISLKTKASRNKFRVPGTGNYLSSSGKSSRSSPKSRCAQGGLG